MKVTRKNRNQYIKFKKGNSAIKIHNIVQDHDFKSFVLGYGYTEEEYKKGLTFINRYDVIILKETNNPFYNNWHAYTKEDAFGHGNTATEALFDYLINYYE